MSTTWSHLKSTLDNNGLINFTRDFSDSISLQKSTLFLPNVSWTSKTIVVQALASKATIVMNKWILLQSHFCSIFLSEFLNRRPLQKITPLSYPVLTRRCSTSSRSAQSKTRLEATASRDAGDDRGDGGLHRRRRRRHFVSDESSDLESCRK